MQIIERTATSKRFRDKSGTVNKHGVKVIRLLGWGVKENGDPSHIAVYECECPLCQKRWSVWGNILDRPRHCGCGPHHVVFQKFRFPVTRRYWCMWRKKMCRAWRLDYFLFLEAVGEMQPHEILIPRRPGGWESVGPGNFVRYMPSNSHPVPMSTLLWVVSREGYDSQLCTRTGMGVVLGISRQAAHQMSPIKLVQRIRDLGWTVETVAQWDDSHPGEILRAAMKVVQ